VSIIVRESDSNTNNGTQKMTTTIKLMAKYKKLEAAAEAMASNRNATSQDRRDSWAEANKVWEQIKAAKKKAKK
jgi:hypothetical protein